MITLNMAKKNMAKKQQIEQLRVLSFQSNILKF